MYRKEDGSHKRQDPHIMHVASVYEWKKQSSTKLEECTRELQGIFLGSVYVMTFWMVPSNPLQCCLSSSLHMYPTTSSCSDLGRPSLGNDEMAGQR